MGIRVRDGTGRSEFLVFAPRIGLKLDECRGGQSNGYLEMLCDRSADDTERRDDCRHYEVGKKASEGDSVVVIE